MTCYIFALLLFGVNISPGQGSRLISNKNEESCRRMFLVGAITIALVAMVLFRRR